MSLSMLASLNRPYVIYLLSFLIAVTIFLINFSIKGPMIQGDEGSYLANAAAIAGFPNDMSSNYHAGYSLLISPAFLFAEGAAHIWFLVKAINAILLGLVFLLLYKIVEIFLPTSKFIYRINISLLVVIYPMWITLSAYSFSENAFVPAFLVVVLLYLKTLKEEGGYWILLGVSIGFLYWIHPKTVAVAIAFMMSLIFFVIKEKKIIGPVVSCVSLSVMILLYKTGFSPWLQEQMLISGQPPANNYPSLQKLFAPFESLERLKKVIAIFAGHVLYLSLGTLGLVWVGIGTMYQKIVAKNQILEGYSKNTYLTFFIFIILSFLGTLTLSSIFMEGAIRFDHWMYGRYVEGVIAPVLLLGLLSQSYRNARISLFIAFTATLILHFWMGHYAHTAPFNISTFWQEFYLREQGLWAWWLSGSVLIMMVSYLPKVRAQQFIALFFIFCSAHQIKYHISGTSGAMKRSDVTRFVRENYKKGSCVGFDQSGMDSYKKHLFWYDFSFALYDYRLQRMNTLDWLTSCEGPLFSYSKNIKESKNIYPLAISSLGGPVLWAKVGAKAVDISPYPFEVKAGAVNSIFFLGDGWNELESHHVWSTQKSVLNIPIPSFCKGTVCQAEINFSVFAASKNRPVKVSFQAKNINQTQVFTDQSRHHILIPLHAEKTVQSVTISIPKAVSPKELGISKDARVLGIALRSIKIIL